MKRMTLEEVEARRKDDRILQGVLTEEENLAEWAIKNVKKGGGLGRETEIIYYFNDGRLEPVLDRIDRLCGNQVLIFGRNKWCAVRNKANELNKETIKSLLPPRAEIVYENEEYMGGVLDPSHTHGE